MSDINDNELLNFKNLFIEYYNSTEPISFDTELMYAKILNLETETQHNVSMIFLAGYLSDKKQHEITVKSMQGNIDSIKELVEEFENNQELSSSNCLETLWKIKTKLEGEN